MSRNRHTNHRKHIGRPLKVKKVKNLESLHTVPVESAQEEDALLADNAPELVEHDAFKDLLHSSSTLSDDVGTCLTYDDGKLQDMMPQDAKNEETIHGTSVSDSPHREEVDFFKNYRRF